MGRNLGIAAGVLLGFGAVAGIVSLTGGQAVTIAQPVLKSPNNVSDKDGGINVTGNEDLTGRLTAASVQSNASVQGACAVVWTAGADAGVSACDATVPWTIDQLAPNAGGEIVGNGPDGGAGVSIKSNNSNSEVLSVKGTGGEVLNIDNGGSINMTGTSRNINNLYHLYVGYNVATFAYAACYTTAQAPGAGCGNALTDQAEFHGGCFKAAPRSCSTGCGGGPCEGDFISKCRTWPDAGAASGTQLCQCQFDQTAQAWQWNVIPGAGDLGVGLGVCW